MRASINVHVYIVIETRKPNSFVIFLIRICRIERGINWKQKLWFLIFTTSLMHVFLVQWKRLKLREIWIFHHCSKIWMLTRLILINSNRHQSCFVLHLLCIRIQIFFKRRGKFLEKLFHFSSFSRDLQRFVICVNLFSWGEWNNFTLLCVFYRYILHTIPWQKKIDDENNEK